MSRGLKLRYPEAHPGNVVDTFHGVTVGDPFRWMEDEADPRLTAWCDANNALVDAFLEGSEELEALRTRLADLTGAERRGTTLVRGTRTFWMHQPAGADQARLVMADAGSAARVLVDPLERRADGTLAIAGVVVDPTGRHVAVALADAGSDWTVWHVIDATTGRWLPDRLDRVKFGVPTWNHDGTAMWYPRYPEPSEHRPALAHQQLCHHRLGDDPAEDRVVISRRDQPHQGFLSTLSSDGRYLAVNTWQTSGRKTRVDLYDVERGEARVPIRGTFDARLDVVDVIDGRILAVTDLDAPRYRLVAIPIDQPDADHWVDLVPERDDVLETAQRVGDKLVLGWLRGPATVLERASLDGRDLQPVHLPAHASVSPIAGTSRSPHASFHVLTWDRPERVMGLDVDTGALTTEFEVVVPWDPATVQVETTHARASDGEEIPISLLHGRGVPRDGSRRALLYGYGGFRVSLTPGFSPMFAALVERGFVVAIAHVRGGGEFGAAWHRAGIGKNKLRSFDDFADVARHLVADGWTSHDRLAICGGSNGGLLVAASLVRHPELIGAVVGRVGVYDMLRYHRFTIGRAWQSDYGLPEDPEMFPILRSYSPYHNVDPSVAYPPVLLTTGDHDDRVVPAHTFKLGAALQATRPESPVLVRTTRRVGHGAGKPVSIQVLESAEIIAFLEAVLPG